MLLATSANSIPGLTEAHFSARIFVCAALLSLASGLFFGALPALRQPTLEVLAGWRSTSPSRTSIRDALVTFQIAGSLIMLTAAGLTLRTLWKLESVPLGINTEHVVTAQFTLGPTYDSTRLVVLSETLGNTFAGSPEPPTLPSPTLFLPAAPCDPCHSSLSAFPGVRPFRRVSAVWCHGAPSLPIISARSMSGCSKAELLMRPTWAQTALRRWS
jgi:hypothetical protein